MRALISAMILTLVGASAYADESCLSNHLLNAMSLNQSRKPLYSKLTGGRSEPVSDQLLLFESVGLVPAFYYDFLASPFQKAGIPILCQELISMGTVRNFSASDALGTNALSAESFEAIDSGAIEAEIRGAYRAGGFEAVAGATEARLQKLQSVPQYHCLIRHFLSSILRTANLAPLHESQANAVGYGQSPEALSWSFIELQLLGLDELEEIDELAAPIQAQGVPILCQDVPVIPPY
jgi:hypothetical protein